MKDLCRKYAIPTAAYQSFTDGEAAKDYVRAQGAPIVVKADGLAAGKGVILCQTVSEACSAIDDILTKDTFKDAAGRIVIEEFLHGEEASFFALVDGQTAIPLVSAQDHKAAYDNDQGPNTGGMGAYTPAPVMTKELEQSVMEQIILPTVRAMADEGHPYQGVLYAGLMIDQGQAKLLEYNARFGDPECQPMMMRLKSDALDMLLACAEGRLDGLRLDWRDETALLVVMAAKGYPGAYQKGSRISGIDAAEAIDGVVVFHAGTRAEGADIVADGGRVLGVTVRAETVKLAQEKAYQAVDQIDWPEGFCRRDIGWRAIERA